jgi:NADH-quinone oxidoreductase subunit M
MSWIIPLQFFLPILFAIGLLLPFKALGTRRGAWLYSACTSTLSFTMSLLLVVFFDWSEPGMQLAGQFTWVETFNLHFAWGVDSISLWLILLTTFLMPIVVLGSLIEVSHDMRQFHFWLHILEAALIGTFIARDILLFYVCFEFSLIPLFFLIGVFGHSNRLRAAGVFFLYTFTGSLLTLAGVLYVVWYGAQTNGVWTFNIVELYAIGQSMPIQHQVVVFLAMLAGFGVKTPLFPFHTWLPLAHTEAPTAGSVDLAGLVLKLGPYGLLRLAIPMLPAAAVLVAPWVGGLAVIGIIYAALICWVQKDAKKLIAYSSVSHMGFCILGLFAFDAERIGVTGAVVYMISHGLATGGLFVCLGMLYDRFETREIRRLSGLAKPMPVWAAFFCLFVFASVGLPGLNGFVGEFLTLMGTFQSPDSVLGIAFAVPAALGVILAAIYLLYLVGLIVFGTPSLPRDAKNYSEFHETGIDPHHDHDLSRREILTVAPLAIACIAIGLMPHPLLQSLQGPDGNGPVVTLTQEVDRYIPEYVQTIDTEDVTRAEPTDLSASGGRLQVAAGHVAQQPEAAGVNPPASATGGDR